MEIDFQLVQKYNVAGPRYTSYPPATHFTDSVSRDEVLSKVAASNEKTQPGISLYFHIPFCRTLCWYCGCTTVITTRQSAAGEYLEYLEREMDLWREWINPKRAVEQLHFGGGTPTFLTPEQIRKLGTMIRSKFPMAPDCEAGVEIDPRRLNAAHVEALRDAGFNRASIGVQDNDPDVQKAVHRIQPREVTERAIEWIRQAGFTSVNIDLIYGLPGQTVESFAGTLQDVLALNPDRFAVFSYAHVPWMKPAQRIFASSLPSPELKFQLLKLTIETLTRAGYVYIGMDHFAKKDDELALAQANKTLQRNFQGYSTRGGLDIYGFGVSSISQADGVYWQNFKELPEYYRALDANQIPLARGYILTGEDRIRRQTISRVMCDLGLDYAAMSELLGLDFQEHFAEDLASLDDLEADGLIERREGSLKVTNRGRLFIRNIAMRFDPYLKTAREGRYSKTI